MTIHHRQLIENTHRLGLNLDAIIASVVIERLEMALSTKERV